MLWRVSASATWQLAIPPRASISPLSDAASANHPGLQLGDFGKSGFDAVLYGANLGSDFVGCIFDHLFAHDFSFPGT